MGQLETDHEVIRPPMGLGMCFDECISHFPDASGMGLIQDQLVGIGTTIMTHGHGFTAPNQLGTGTSEPLPATTHRRGNASIGGSVPPLHWMDGNAVTDAPSIPFKRLR